MWSPAPLLSLHCCRCCASATSPAPYTHELATVIPRTARSPLTTPPLSTSTRYLSPHHPPSLASQYLSHRNTPLHLLRMSLPQHHLSLASRHLSHHIAFSLSSRQHAQSTTSVAAYFCNPSPALPQVSSLAVITLPSPIYHLSCPVCHPPPTRLLPFTAPFGTLLRPVCYPHCPFSLPHSPR